MIHIIRRKHCALNKNEIIVETTPVSFTKGMLLVLKLVSAPNPKGWGTHALQLREAHKTAARTKLCAQLVASSPDSVGETWN